MLSTVHHDQTLDPERWLSQAQPAEQVGDAIRKQLHAELEGGESTGMRPFLEEGRLRIVQRWAIVVAER